MMITGMFPGGTGANITGDDKITLYTDGTFLYIDHTPAGGATQTYSYTPFLDGFSIDGGANDDSIDVQGSIFLTVTLIGNTGNDTLAGNKGNDSMEGGAGTDVLFGSEGDDSFIGGSGTDSADYSNLLSSSFTVRGNLSTGVADVFFSGTDIETDTLSTENLAGGPGPDTLTGNASNNEIFGVGGADSINAGSGNDFIDGGGGDDVTLDGSSGADTIVGGSGNDILQGGSNNDSLDGSSGTDTLYGSDGLDTLIGGSGVGDSMRGGNDNDGFNSADGFGNADKLFGESGSDFYIVAKDTDDVANSIP